MAKLRNRIKKKQQKSVIQGQTRQSAQMINSAQKEKMRELIEDGDFVAAMDVLAELALQKQIDGELMYWGALCYYKTGDYDRAATWLNNALSCGNNGAKVKLLLGAVCLVQERYADGLKLFEHVLTACAAEIDDEDRDGLLDMMDHFQKIDQDLLKEYPTVSEFIQKYSAPPAAEQNTGAVNREAKMTEAKAALAKLRAMLNKHKAKNAADIQPIAADAVPSAVEAEQVQSVEPLVEDEQVQQEAVECQAETEFDVSATLTKVMGQAVSLKEKIRLLNMFAAGCYQSGDYQSAFDLLSAALELDGQDAAVLKNIAYVCLAAGEREQAMEYAAKLPMVDFGLLYNLRQG